MSSECRIGGNAGRGPFCCMFGGIDAVSVWWLSFTPETTSMARNGRPRKALAADVARRLRYRKSATHDVRMSVPVSRPTMRATGGRWAPPSPAIFTGGVDESGALDVGRIPNVLVASSVWMFMSPGVLDAGEELELCCGRGVPATSTSPEGGCVTLVPLCVMGDFGESSGARGVVSLGSNLSERMLWSGGVEIGGKEIGGKEIGGMENRMDMDREKNVGGQRAAS
jgi:hypothetical protein